MQTTVQQLMSAPPRTIGADMSLAAARCMMMEYGVRHLPVREDGRLVGVVGIKDLDRAAPYRTVAEVMKRDPVVVFPTDPAAPVALAMVDRRTDAAIVVSGGHVVGIFTAADAARTLGDTLRAASERR